MSEYTKEEILALSEYELREEAAKLLGWKREWNDSNYNFVWFDEKGSCYDKTGNCRVDPPPASWETVGAIIEALNKKDMWIVLSQRMGDGKYCATIMVPAEDSEGKYYSEICWAGDISSFIATVRAALIAVNNL